MVLLFAAVPAERRRVRPESEFPTHWNLHAERALQGRRQRSAGAEGHISPQQIVSNIGVCTILDTKQDGKSFQLHVECKFPAGPLVGDITFTPRPDKTVKFVDRDNTYNAVLSPLPELSRARLSSRSRRGMNAFLDHSPENKGARR